MTQDPWSEATEIESERIQWSTEAKEPLVGKVVEGIVLSRKTQPNVKSNSPGAESITYELYTAEGLKWFFATAILDRKLENQKGKLVRIEVTGKVKTQKGNWAHTFSVRSMPNTIENRTAVGISVLGEEIGKDEKPEDDVLSSIPF